MNKLKQLIPLIEFVQHNQILVMFLAMTGTITFALYVILKLIEKL